MSGPEDLRALHPHTQQTYARNAAAFDAERTKTLFERPWLERFCASLPARARVLDLGCGSGEPIAAYLIAQGLEITGVDFAEPMLAMARERFPQATWLLGDLRTLSLSQQFDGLIAWHSLFHLTQAEQRELLPKLPGLLAPGGVLLATVGCEAGEVVGYIAGEPVYHAVLAAQEYFSLLESAGMQIAAFTPHDPACGAATVLLARRNEASPP